MQLAQRFVLIILLLLFAYVGINRHSMLINYFSGQLSTISALLVIGCLRPPSSLANHVSSASLHRYTPVLVGVALLGHHSAKAEFRKVNGSNFKGTPYEDSPVRVNGSNMYVFTSVLHPLTIGYDELQYFLDSSH